MKYINWINHLLLRCHIRNQIIFNEMRIPTTYRELKSIFSFLILCINYFKLLRIFLCCFKYFSLIKTHHLVVTLSQVKNIWHLNDEKKHFVPDREDQQTFDFLGTLRPGWASELSWTQQTLWDWLRYHERRRGSQEDLGWRRRLEFLLDEPWPWWTQP